MNQPTEQTPLSASKTVSPSAYNALVAAARLKDIRLIKSNFTLDPEGVEIEPSFKLVHDCEIENAHYSEDRDSLYVSVSASAACKKKNKNVLTLKSHYLLVYEVKGEPEEDVVNAFAKRVARFAAYPYFRAHFAELTMQAGVHLPPLPVIKETRLLLSTNAPQLAPKKDESKAAE